ncbi:MAG TPA: hypothetical protein VNN80_33620 [Polyangiaceae bacterium]|nr:hypothetical protein [Polyangiaceae bacterium]
MTRALFSWPSVIGLAFYAAMFGCNSAGPQPRLLHPAVDQRLSQGTAEAEQGSMVIAFVTSSEAPRSSPAEGAFDASSVPAEETIVPVDEYSVEESSRVLRFIAAKRGDQPVGVRVFFASAEEGEGGAHLGLRRADRIEEVDGLPVAGLDAFMNAWRGVGVKPEVRFYISRAGRPHTLIYRRRAPGMLLAD